MGEDLIREIHEAFSLPAQDYSQYAPLTLAYIGDNIYELVNRTVSVSRGDRQVEKLNRECSMRAKAPSQARAARQLLPELSDEEAAVYRRGRNATVYTKAKNATVTEYHEATGLEALIGYLYLTGRYARLTELLQKAFDYLEDTEAQGAASRFMEGR